MGNEQSHIPGIEIVDKAVEVCDYWSQHSAFIDNQENSTKLTVFTGDSFINGSLWTTQTPLEKNAKHIMIYRHPSIVKYISSWQKNSKFYLAVEEVFPLSQELPKLNSLQISVGIYSILKALHFLHKSASVSHNNVCISSIYISKEGNWKLAGMEYLCKYDDLTCDYLMKTKFSRYNKAVDPNEEKLLENKLNRKDFIDIYAFGVLVCEVLASKVQSDTFLLESFFNFCKNDLQNVDVSKRPTFKTILEHEFFKLDFISVHSFLLELPLKNDADKITFFENLVEKLSQFDEEVVASHLCSFLFSRMVLLNKAAQKSLLPFLLTPRSDEEENSKSILSNNNFKKYLCPKILDIFKVHDVEIRLILLNYFPKYMHLFTTEELQSKILPELLVGIKDTNDYLVSMTLKTLANLVPILGSTTVIGGKRAKLFNDGRPTSIQKRGSVTTNKPVNISIATSSEMEMDQISLNSLRTEINIIDDLPERPRPDGEEETSTEEVEPSADEDADNWEDWDINGASQNIDPIMNIEDTTSIIVEHHSLDSEKEAASRKTKIIPDILELDIKTQKTSELETDFNFFEDMEPVIEKSNKFVIDNKNETNAINSKLALQATDDEISTGWEEEDWD